MKIFLALRCRARLLLEKELKCSRTLAKLPPAALSVPFADQHKRTPAGAGKGNGKKTKLLKWLCSPMS